ncbi:MAG TPA: VOC family protein [Chloroflexota bacterium]|nr:VOC family protein [Chloroflexota bacterium]
MSEAPDYPPGTPMWVDMSASDLEGAVRFYTELFGWQPEDLGEEAGHYTMMRKDGKMAAAVGPQMNPQAPPSWTSYVATTDAAASAQKAKDAGGQVVMEPFDVMQAGKMAGFLDPAGAFICVWQPGQHQGAEIVNAPGGFTWNELQTRDAEAAKQFYPKTFGWGIKENAYEGGTYIEWTVNGKSIAGCMQMGDNFPPNVPSHWLVYFAVDDADAAVSKIQQLGGRVMMGPMDSPAGRFAVVADPQGAAFAVIKLPA